MKISLIIEARLGSKRLEKNNKKNIDEDIIKILESALDYINDNKDLSVLKNEFDKKK